MSKGTLLFSVVAAALVTGVQLQVGKNPTIVVKTELKAGMEIVFGVNGTSNFRLDFLTNDCAKIMRLDFQHNQNKIAMSTYDGQKWIVTEPANYQFKGIITKCTIRVTGESFNIYIGNGTEAVTQYIYALPLTSIRQVRLKSGERNEVYWFTMADNGRQILDDWMHPGASGIRIFGTPTSNFTIALMAAHHSVALSASLQSSYFGFNSRIAGQAWGEEKRDGAFALQLNQPIAVHILAKEEKVYKVKVNGEVIDEYRSQVDASSVNGLKVDGLPSAYIVHLTDPQETAESIPCKANGDEYLNVVKIDKDFCDCDTDSIV